MLLFLDKLIYRPWWQQVLMLLAGPLCFFCAGYYGIILPLNRDILYLQQDIINQNEQIVALVEKLKQYPTPEALMQKLSRLQQQPKVHFTQKQIATLLTEQIEQSNMILRVFQPQEGVDKALWNIELVGTYQQFIHFIHEAIMQRVPWSIQQLSVTKEDEYLIFSLLVYANQS